MTLALVLLNVVAFLVELADPNAAIVVFALWPVGVVGGGHAFHVWQIATYSVLHANLSHLAVNVLGLYMFGREVGNVLGAARVLKLYAASVAGGALVQLVVAALSHAASYPTIGASAGVFGMLVSYALLFPTRRIVLLFPPIPMPAWLFATGYTLLELSLGVSGAQAGVAHFAHLGGVAAAIALLAHWMADGRRHPDLLTVLSDRDQSRSGDARLRRCTRDPGRVFNFSAAFRRRSTPCPTPLS